MTTEIEAAANELGAGGPVKTLRDEMAMAALTGIANNDFDFEEDWPATYIAERAYVIADAMMEARKK